MCTSFDAFMKMWTIRQKYHAMRWTTKHFSNTNSTAIQMTETHRLHCRPHTHAGVRELRNHCSHSQRKLALQLRLVAYLRISFANFASIYSIIYFKFQYDCSHTLKKVFVNFRTYCPFWIFQWAAAEPAAILPPLPILREAVTRHRQVEWVKRYRCWLQKGHKVFLDQLTNEMNSCCWCGCLYLSCWSKILATMHFKPTQKIATK